MRRSATRRCKGVNLTKHNGDVKDGGSSWIVVVRDVSRSVRVQGEPKVIACLVLDMGNGQVLGQAMAASQIDALRQACRTALFKPLGVSSVERPDTILCPVGLANPLAREFRRLKVPDPRPEVVESAPVYGAEDVLDSLIGYLAGRRQPKEFATPADFRLLVREAFAFYKSHPWSLFTDEDDLSVRLGVGDTAATFTAVVLGNAGLQHGLVLYPGSFVPASVRSYQSVDQVETLPGTIMFTLDPESEPPEDVVAKWRRYGWPAGSELVPAFFMAVREGGCDLGRKEVLQLTAAIVAITRFAQEASFRDVVPAKPLKGRVALADTVANFTVRHQAGSSK